MDMSKYGGSIFVKCDHVRDGPIQVTIASVEEGRFAKPDLLFDDGSRFSVNATNARALIRHYGSRSEDWIGKEIELSLGQAKYNGELNESVIVTPISPAIEKPKPKSFGPDDMGDKIPF